MRVKSIYCYECGAKFPPGKVIFSCVKCGGSLDIEYDYSEIKKILRREKDFLISDKSHWKYWMFYPITNLMNIITLGEGGSPLFESEHFDNLYFKYEGVNPTGSFKDRGTTVEVSRAVELGVKKVACASTGNMGASVAAYCAKAGIKATIFVPKFAPEIKKKQIKAYNAEVKVMKGDYDDALAKTKELRKKTGIYLMGDYPIRGAGEKSVGFELMDQLNWKSPDYLIAPIGNGTLIYGIFKSFMELKTVGLIKKIPKIIGVQAVKCNPVYLAFKSERRHIPVQKNPDTVATAIACGDPMDGLEALDACLKSKGEILQVTEKEILNAKKEIGREGIYAEPAGAVSYAGFKKLKPEGKGVCIITGHGLKS